MKPIKKIVYICNKSGSLKTLVFEKPEKLNMKNFEIVWGKPFMTIFEKETF